MALQLSTDLDIGITASNAYYKIERVVSTKDFMAISVVAYFDQASRLAGKETLFSEYYEVTAQEDIDKYVKGIGVGSGDIVARGYDYLKEKIDKFSTALDV